MSGRPTVGVLPGLAVPESGDDGLRAYVGVKYLRCVLDAGGLPLVLAPGSPPADVFRKVDGLMLVGGPDIDPKEYGEDPHEKTKTGPGGRFEFEKPLLLQRPDAMPVLGVCYGCQALNVALGGTLRQHVEGHEGGVAERVKIEPGTRLAEAVGATEAETLSYHHQAVERVADGLRVTAWCGEVPEAVEGTGEAWVVGVQWHPERTPESDVSKRLFRSFVEACGRYREEQDACGTW